MSCFLSRRTLIILAAIVFVACIETAGYAMFRPRVATIQQEGCLGAVDAAKALELVNSIPDLFVIDVRSRKEFEGVHFPGAVNMPLYDFSRFVREIPPQRPVLIHCMLGYRALQAYKILRRLRPDITDVHYVAGRLLAPPLD